MSKNGGTPPIGKSTTLKPTDYERRKIMKICDGKTKQLFIKYLKEHPDERFMQAVRNFVGVPFLVATNSTPEEGDTFYWKCDEMLEEK